MDDWVYREKRCRSPVKHPSPHTYNLNKDVQCKRLRDVASCLLVLVRGFR